MTTTATQTAYRNQIGLTMLPDDLYSQVFKNCNRPTVGKSTLNQITAHLEHFGFKVPIDEFSGTVVTPKLPELLGDNLEQHFDSMAAKFSSFKLQAVALAKSRLPEKPTRFQYKAGWVRYKPGCQPEAVEYPLEQAIVFDTETMVKLGNLAVLAAAVSSEAWYIWLHPQVANPSLKNPYQFRGSLVPLGYGRLVIGHNVAFDRVRVAEEYNLAAPANRYLDTMSMHNSLCAITSKQRPLYLMAKKGSLAFVPPWTEHVSGASLVDCYNFHCKPLKPLVAEDKTIRNLFVHSDNIQPILDNRDALIWYCLGDVEYTHELFSAVLPKYLNNSPGSVSFAGSLLMGSTILPVGDDWQTWYYNCEIKYNQVKDRMAAELTAVGESLHQRFLAGEDFSNDPWYSELDWSPAKTGKTKGYAAWYRKLTSNGVFKVTKSSRVTPYLLRLTWNNSPIIYVEKYGWCFLATEDTNLSFQLTDGRWVARVPHKDGDTANCGDPLAKDYIKAADNGTLSSDSDFTRELLDLAVSISYWTSVRERVKDQIVLPAENPWSNKATQVIIPHMVVAGTATRRAVEKLWLTVSSAKKNKIGSELKSRVQAPDGCYLVGADFDTQEMMIGGMFADSDNFGLHGSTAMSYSIITGTKEAKTDVHSTMAQALGITRDDAKGVNFSLIYYTGKTGLAGYLKQKNPTFSDREAREKAETAIRLRRGKQVRKDIWADGTDSAAYNFMGRLVNSMEPRSPLMNVKIPDSLNPQILRNEFKPSSFNWTVQTSGVDILHCYLVAVDYLIDLWSIPARFCMVFHDEAWFICRKGYERLLAKAKQVAHLWVWSLFAYRLGLDDLPYNRAWFSAVNVDTCWRKEIKMSQLTPSNHVEPEPGFELHYDQVFDEVYL